LNTALFKKKQQQQQQQQQHQNKHFAKTGSQTAKRKKLRKLTIDSV